MVSRYQQRLRQFRAYQRDADERDAKTHRHYPLLVDYQLTPDLVARIRVADASRISGDRLWNQIGCVGQAIASILILATFPITIPAYHFLLWAYRSLFPDPLLLPRENLKKYQVALADYERWSELVAKENERRVARSRASYWEALDGTQFEHAVADLLRALGHNVRRVGGAGDAGIDLWLDETVIVQCKAHAGPVAPAVIREVLGARMHSGAKRAIVVSSRGFTAGALPLAAQQGIELWDAKHLVSLQQKAGTLPT